MKAGVKAVFDNKRLWAVHVIGNAALLAAIYGWLWIPDRTVLDLTLSTVAALTIVLLVSWLHAGTLHYFRLVGPVDRNQVWATFKPSLRRILMFTLWLLLLFAAILLVLQLKDRLGPASNWTASALTLRLRRPVHPVRVLATFSAAVNIVAFAVVPFLFLQFWKLNWSWRHIATYALLFVLCAYLPYRVVWWVPKVNGVYAQATSMLFRFSVAYLLAVTGWLVLVSTLGARKAAGN